MMADAASTEQGVDLRPSSAHPEPIMDHATASDPLIEIFGARARSAGALLARSSTGQRNDALRAAAIALRAHAPAILEANARDLANLDPHGHRASEAFRDRLRLTPARVAAMADGVAAVADLPDPLTKILAEWARPNGLVIRRVPQPIGVIGMIYESRPNVGADAAALCLKSGNAVLLRGGSESLGSATTIHAAMQAGLDEAGLPRDAVQIAPSADRAFVAAMLSASGLIDLIIPRGGKSLVERVQREARVPVLAHAEGLNHTYIHAEADPAMARAVLANAKMRRPGVCGATETLLLDAAIAPALLPLLIADLAALGCVFRADARARAILPDLPAAADTDFHTEWLDAILSIKLVDGVQEALAHIAAHGSSHTEAIVTQDRATAEIFLAGIDAAVGLWNASTQFCDGGEFGFGAEIGIATGRLHARGPVGLDQLVTYRYQITGTGQVRP
ncbi:MAG TPA: glutamate-5-semialdehyde dehydrogenase [Acidiphilium sp.]|nr:MAG: glutamate-5-semialdehyde dehydrogenase [Acidiphilium sp. 21-60-14]OYV90394.1 MAG: glutamate-5-semialdehyde dehydrogenase [Acidiphilium sp. 37-60-79]OZB40473.1 MAG: glutamate-5-semialdehyde dehydrogenase [Acidiphilium sp. 34-60-192]HQT88940.1 glutamate-5-semialdehyde dehydrogenase [Acidiphilium sp.]HQU24468.1 glutamate-5-semialdehyde dehydrogenase [Acidiphilium sp.]